MGDFGGAFARNGAGIDPALVRRLTNGLPGVLKPRVVEGPSFVVAHRPFALREAPDALPFRLSDGSVLAMDGRLDEPAETAATLGLPRTAAFLDLVAAACERWGDRAAEHLAGHFALAMWDDREHRMVLSRDVLGARPLFYVEMGPLLLFATSLPLLLAFPETSREIDELVLAQTLTIEPKDHEQTLYRHIRRVPPGGIAIFAAASNHIRRYWTADDIRPVRFKRDDDYVEAGRALLDRAVRARTPDDRIVGVTLSGGLDSSGIAATIARQSPTRSLLAFYRAPGAAHPYDALDERALIALMTERYPNIALSVVDDARTYQRDIEPELDAAAFALPGAGSVNVGWFESLSADVDRAGVEVLMTGSAGNVTLSWPGSPDIGRDLTTGRWLRALRTIGIGARSSHQSIARFLAGQALGAMAPHALQRWRRRHASGSPWSDYSLVSEDFLRRVDYAAHARDVGFDIPFKKSPTALHARLQALQSQVNRDKATALRRQFAVESRDPYGFQPLVEFTLGSPNDQFWRAGKGRLLARRVLADRVPAPILRETRRGMQCPEWYAVMSGRREGMIEALERIERSPLASRVVDTVRMRDILENWPKDADAAKYAGAQIYAHALNRALSIGGFLRWYEGGNG